MVDELGSVDSRSWHAEKQTGGRRWGLSSPGSNVLNFIMSNQVDDTVREFCTYEIAAENPSTCSEMNLAPRRHGVPIQVQ